MNPCLRADLVDAAARRSPREIDETHTSVNLAIIWRRTNRVIPTNVTIVRGLAKAKVKQKTTAPTEQVGHHGNETTGDAATMWIHGVDAMRMLIDVLQTNNNNHSHSNGNRALAMAVPIARRRILAEIAAQVRPILKRCMPTLAHRVTITNKDVRLCRTLRRNLKYMLVRSMRTHLPRRTVNTVTQCLKVMPMEASTTLILGLLR